MENRRRIRFYDHRLARAVQDVRDITIATLARLTRSTAAGWLKQAPRQVIRFGTGAHIPDQLARERTAARQARLEADRARRCATCA